MNWKKEAIDKLCCYNARKRALRRRAGPADEVIELEHGAYPTMPRPPPASAGLKKPLTSRRRSEIIPPPYHAIHPENT